MRFMRRIGLRVRFTSRVARPGWGRRRMRWRLRRSSGTNIEALMARKKGRGSKGAGSKRGQTRVARASAERALKRASSSSRARAAKRAPASTPRSPQPQKLRGLFPAIEPYNSGFLKVSDLHEIYYEECGN